MTPEALLRHRLDPVEARLCQPELRELLGEFRALGSGEADAPDLGDSQYAMACAWASFLVDRVRGEVGHIEALRSQHEMFLFDLGRLRSADERERRILDSSRQLGSTPKQLRADRSAFGRWFDAEAASERYQTRVQRAEHRLTFLLGRVGAILRLVFEGQGEASGRSDFAGNGELEAAERADPWCRLAEKGVLALVRHAGDRRVAVAALKAFCAFADVLDPGRLQQVASTSFVRFLTHTAQAPRSDVWMQCAALEALRRVSRETFMLLVASRLRWPASGDDLFVRRYIVRHLLTFDRSALDSGAEAGAGDLVEVVTRDPSPFVRQALADRLLEAPADLVEQFWPALARDDGSPQVRAQALLGAPELAIRESLLGVVLETVSLAIRHDPDGFSRRVAFEVAVRGYSALQSTVPTAAEAWDRCVSAALEEVRRLAPQAQQRRWAAFAAERLWLESREEARGLAARLRPIIRSIRPGQSRLLPCETLAGHDEELVGRVMSVLAINDFGLDLERGSRGDRLTRGPVLRFRLWRFLYEWRHPASDKRQAYRHTVGRVQDGEIRAPSAILSELAQTTVPGEPLYMEDEDGWRPYLPLVDDVLSSLNRLGASRPIRFFTSEGVTEMGPPESLAERLTAWVRLTWSFARYSELRNWRADRRRGPEAYLTALRQLGFSFRFRPHGAAAALSDSEAAAASPTVVDAEILRFFPLAALPPSLSDWWPRMRDYFLSPYENSVGQLAMFIVVVLFVFLGRHYLANRALRRARRSIALVVGGWGTRGKSGTERIKAAMLNATGAPIVSKTTGCEAMLLQAPAFGRMLELYLYRPYDKATIWEQKNVVGIASKLGSRVFLWECMGLTPANVEILQRHWMRDDLSTLTNTFPDHEDLQGPSGYDVAKAMASFVPRDGCVLTTEELMYPVLEQEARRRGSSIRSLGWLEAGLLTHDVLERFPYEEHPHNIALVLGVGEELGIDRDFALKEMADRVVPDLGVLRTYPRARVRTRTLEFVMGNSANERHGALSNWRRMGFADHSLEREPHLWVTTLVNNRADRAPRSLVFAAILAQEVSADRHILVGSNLQGLVGSIRKAWDESLKDLTLWRDTREDGLEGPRSVFLKLARRLRQPTTEATVEARLGAMLGGRATGADLVALRALAGNQAAVVDRLKALALGEVADEIARQLADDAQSLAVYRQFDEKLESVLVAGATSDEARKSLDGELHKILWQWFRKKIVVIEDYFATGDQIVDRLVRETPPNLLTRIMGMQNIKGTGLDFVYRWEGWRLCCEACQKLKSEDPAEAAAALQDLATFRDHGILTEDGVREAVVEVRRTGNPGLEADLDRVLKNLDESMHEVCASIAAAGPGTESDLPRRAKVVAVAVGWLEQILDAAVDSVRRRRTADLIYRDLIEERISRPRAIRQMKALIKRQKGGWLKQALERRDRPLL